MFKTMQPFYTDGRRFLHLTASQIDSYVAKGAVASFAGNTVTISAPGESDYFAKVRIAGKRRAAGWVNKFNQRSTGRFTQNTSDSSPDLNSDSFKDVPKIS